MLVNAATCILYLVRWALTDRGRLTMHGTAYPPYIPQPIATQGSVLIGHSYVLDIARDNVPRSFWQHPGFIRTCNLCAIGTGVGMLVAWAAAMVRDFPVSPPPTSPPRRACVGVCGGEGCMC